MCVQSGFARDSGDQLLPDMLSSEYVCRHMLRLVQDSHQQPRQPRTEIPGTSQKSAEQTNTLYKQLLATVGLVGNDENVMPSGFESEQRQLACFAAAAQPLTAA